MSLATLNQPRIIYSRPADPYLDTTVARSESLGQLDGGWSCVVRSLHALASLEDNWDGLGAAAPSPAVVRTAVDVAERLRDGEIGLPTTAVATPAGTILFGWEEGRNYQEIEVVSPTLVEWMTVDQNGVAEHGAVSWRDLTGGDDRFQVYWALHQDLTFSGRPALPISLTTEAQL